MRQAVFNPLKKISAPNGADALFPFNFREPFVALFFYTLLPLSHRERAGVRAKEKQC
jgi:hypothetical protein